jgi:hypothetical protein
MHSCNSPCHFFFCGAKIRRPRPKQPLKPAPQGFFLRFNVFEPYNMLFKKVWRPLRSQISPKVLKLRAFPQTTVSRYFPIPKNTVKKMNFSHYTGSNLPPTDADGIISPDIVNIVHLAKGKLIFIKPILTQLHIIRFQKGSAHSQYWAYTAVYCQYTAAPKPGTPNWFPKQLCAKWRRRTIIWDLNWSWMAPREHHFAPQGHNMYGIG